MNNSPKLSIIELIPTKIFYKFRIRETLDLIIFNLNIVLKPKINLNLFKKDKNIIEVYFKKVGRLKKNNNQTNNIGIKKIKAEI